MSQNQPLAADFFPPSTVGKPAIPSETLSTKAFRTLTQLLSDIATNRLFITTKQNDLDAFRQIIAEKILPLQNEYRDIKLDIFQILCGHVKRGQLKKRQEDKLKEHLIDLAIDLEVDFDVDLEVERTTLLGDDIPDEEEMELIQEIDSLFEKDFEKLFHRENEKMGFEERDDFKKPGSKSNAKGKSKTEDMKSSEEQSFAGDIRALYLLLARALHPDKELDETRRLEKTKWMQKVTDAYGNKKLADLLDILGQNPLDAVGPYLSQAPAKTIQGFTKRLKRELTQLKQEATNFNYQMDAIGKDFFKPTGGLQMQNLNAEIKTNRKQVETLKTNRENLRRLASIEELLQLLKQYDWNQIL